MNFGLKHVTIVTDLRYFEKIGAWTLMPSIGAVSPHHEINNVIFGKNWEKRQLSLNGNRDKYTTQRIQLDLHVLHSSLQALSNNNHITGIFMTRRSAIIFEYLRNINFEHIITDISDMFNFVCFNFISPWYKIYGFTIQNMPKKKAVAASRGRSKQNRIFRDLRMKFLKQFYCHWSNYFKLENLMSTQNTKLIINLAKYIYQASKIRIS